MLCRNFFNGEARNSNGMDISVICFSKDRPLQLEAYLRSLRKFSGQELPVIVLVKAEKPFREAYKQLMKCFPWAKLIWEKHFMKQVLISLKKIQTPFVMFGCDDVFFKRPWDPSLVVETFNREPDLLCFSLRLGTEIRFCHPINGPSPPPSFIKEDPLLVWNWREAKGIDWAYPFEMNCTVHRLKVVEHILDEMSRQKVDWGSPNRLEGKGMEYMRATRGVDLMASYPHAVANCLTVNRVQDEHLNPLYEGQDLNVHTLLDMWNRGFRLDIDQYRERTYDRIHIGEVFFTK
jgi:hypothetical protein